MSLSLVRLLQLASPALPVGAYTYSQGLEWAVDVGAVRDEAGALVWIGDLLEWNIGGFEAPLVAMMYSAWIAADGARLRQLDALFVASRETGELRAETLQMGYSLRRLLDDLAEDAEYIFAICRHLREYAQPSFPLAWSGIAAAWRIPAADALTAYLWTWAENQTMAALKAVPLGQTAGQRLLLALGARIPTLVARALQAEDEDLSNFAPGFGIACSRHETQYSRLFRS